MGITMRRAHRISGRAKSCQTRLSIGKRQRSDIYHGAREALKDSMWTIRASRCLIFRCARSKQRESYIDITGAMINSNHIEPRRFLEDAGNVMLERVRDTVERHSSVKVNTVFNSEFAMNKCALNMLIKT